MTADLPMTERVPLALRALYEAHGYKRYRMGRFEPYDVYAEHRGFLKGEGIITFTDSAGRLMALKPDVTLGIVKNTQPGATAKYYYNESVFRLERHGEEYREIAQMGVEYIGADAGSAAAEVVSLAVSSLAAISGEYVLDVSHMGFITSLLNAIGVGDELLSAIKQKNAGAVAALADRIGPYPERRAAVLGVAALRGPLGEALQTAEKFCLTEDMRVALEELRALSRALAATGADAHVRLDFSVINDIDYYNGLVFRGFVRETPWAVLAGGRYDNLMRRLGKPQGGLGFALYLSELERAFSEQDEPTAPPASGAANGALTVALPKGRLGESVFALFNGGSIDGLGRKLVFEDEARGIRYLLVKPADVAIYVERGAADVGVVGKDVLLETEPGVHELMDLRLGVCKLAVAARPGFCDDPSLPIRVATKYPGVTRRFYAAKHRQVDIIKLSGSIELAPLLGLSDAIVDIVETGETLKENELEVIEDVADVSARLIAGKSAYRFKQGAIERLMGVLNNSEA